MEAPLSSETNSNIIMFQSEPCESCSQANLSPSSTNCTVSLVTDIGLKKKYMIFKYNLYILRKINKEKTGNIIQKLILSRYTKIHSREDC